MTEIAREMKLSLLRRFRVLRKKRQGTWSEGFIYVCVCPFILAVRTYACACVCFMRVSVCVIFLFPNLLVYFVFFIPVKWLKEKTEPSCLPVCLPIYSSICLPINLSVTLSICRLHWLSVILSFHLSIWLSISLTVSLYVSLSIDLSTYLSDGYLLVSLSVSLFVWSSITLGFYLLIYLRRLGLRKRRYAVSEILRLIMIVC